MLKPKRLKLIKKQIHCLERRLTHLSELSARFSKVRLFTFLAGFALGIAANYLLSPAAGWSVWGLTLIVFNFVAHAHRKVTRSIRKHEIWLELKQTQVARMTLDWSAIPAPAILESDHDHPFQFDLDITGKRSLHQLLDTAISKDGSSRLLDWLLTTAPNLSDIEKRQAMVQELRPLARFRDKLHLAFKLVSKDQLDGKRLLRFLERQELSSRLDRVLGLASLLAVVNIVLFTLSSLADWPAYWGASLAVYVGVHLVCDKLKGSLLDESVFLAEELRKFRSVLRFLEGYALRQYENLNDLCAPFQQAGHKPSEELRRITWISAAIGLRMNPLMGIALNLVAPWDFYFARALVRLKVDLAEDVAVWLSTLTELEALGSLGNFAYLNPDAVFPEIKAGQAGGDSALNAEALGHPLIADEVRKCNDFTFAEIGEVALITGSNMSGKSTFLKTLGINLSLAYAGAPVVARRLSTRPFRLFTCIQINDSIADGFSFFYAEVRRLKALLLALEDNEQLPLLFLIDEIFRGTNNRERLIGSQSYLQALAGLNGLGAISTHDLELTKLADTIPQITNSHFREEVVDGRMVFDYKMRPGPCPSTNALKIMRMEGLPVQDA